MSVKIGHSSIDENGHITGGKAGDQTGREVFITDWYKKGWTVLLRPKDANVAERMARACEAGCANDNIGYDQNQRNTLRARAREVSWDLSKIAVPCECDCSSFMAVCAEAAGVDMEIAYSSGNAPATKYMREKFLKTGAFEALTDKKYLTSPDWLQRGDVLVYEGHHTVMVLTDGEKVEREEVGGMFDTMDDIRKNAPWAEGTVRKLIDKKAITGNTPDTDKNGDPVKMGLSRDMLRVLVVMDRAGAV